MHPAAVVYPATERRFLPAITQGFGIGQREPLADGLRRVTVEQFDGALVAMATQPVGVAAHEVRKITKRLRAVLRLVRSGLGDDRYRAENAILRDIARLLAPLRDADVRLETVSVVRERFESQLRPTVFAALTDALSRRRGHIQEAAPDTDEWHKAAFALRSARARYAAWPVDEESARAHGMAVIPHGFAAVAGGLSATYARGRQEMAEACRRPTADNFHAWRKRAKYLRHQLEILSPVFPEVVGGYASSLGRLGDLLGDEHDLAELLRALAARPDLSPDPIERSLLVALAQHRRAELHTAALSLGSRVYAEPADRFTKRIEEYWKAWDEPLPVGFVE